MSVSTRTFGDGTSDSIVLFVGGSGDTKDSYTKLIDQLQVIFPEYKFITFSFKGTEENRDNSLHSHIQDLEDVLDTITKNENPTITIVATSNGAFSTSHLLINGRFNHYIKNIILLDPADYYIETKATVKEARTWTGIQEYKPHGPTTSTLLKEITSDAKVHVINFIIRNYGSEGYVETHKRGIDNEKKYSRLNNEMVKSFYKNTPSNNKGQYIEDNTLPHAFMRDGDINKNIQRIIQIIQRCLDSN